MKRKHKKPPRERYVVKTDGSKHVSFVPDPEFAGRWLRVHPCVVFRECPHCLMPAGTPCRSEGGGFTVGHHYKRSLGMNLRDTLRLKRINVVQTRGWTWIH